MSRRGPKDVNNPADNQDSSLINAARNQVETARLRRESLVASGRFPWVESESDARTWKKLPNYRFLRELHRGGQGTVYLAIQESTNRQVAVKVMRGGSAHKAAEVGRFEREVEALSILKHPNVVSIHDCGRFEGEFFLVMDYVQGRALDLHFADTRPTSNEALSLFARICDGVNAAHLRGVIHRDLKPSNIRIDDEGNPRILDFGLAKMSKRDQGAQAIADVTVTGQFIGSLPWASPEQALGQFDELDIRTDVYSLGVIFYQLLTDDFPYPVGGRMEEVIRHITTTDPVRPSTYEKEIVNDVETILLKSLAKEPDRRYQSAGELGRDIRRYVAGEPIEAKGDSFGYVLRKQLLRHRITVAVVMSFVLLLAGGFVTSLSFWYDANRALLEKEVQRKLADKRADQTQKVADFQSKMLSDIDVEAMGHGIKERYREEVRAAVERQYVGEFPARRKRTPEEIDAEMAAFDERASAAQAVDVARRVLDEYVLKPADDALEQQFPDQPLVQAQIQDAIGSVYQSLGMYAQAESHYDMALSVRQSKLREDHAGIASGMVHRAVMRYFAHDYAASESLCREAIDIQRNLPTQDHVGLAHALYHLGRVRYELGDFTQAEKFLREALSIREQLTGEQQIIVGSILTSLATLLHAQSDSEAAEALYREALEIQRKYLGHEHPDVTFAMQGLASCLGHHDLAAAESLLFEILEIQRRRLGNDHPEVSVSLSNLSWWTELTQGKGAGESFARESVAIRRKLMGDDDPKLALSLLDLARTLRNRGEFAEAEPLCREALSILETSKTPERHLIASGRTVLGQILAKSTIDSPVDSDIRLARLDEAENLFLSAEKIMAIPEAKSSYLKRQQVVESLLRLYELRHRTEPDKGFDAKAAFWRERYNELISPVAP